MYKGKLQHNTKWYLNGNSEGPWGPWLSPYWDVCWRSSLPLATSKLGAWGRRRWNVTSKMQMHPDKWCRKHVLCNSGNLDILQSQMNMSANTVGQLLGYLKRRFKKQVGVTSQAAGTVEGLPLLWQLSCFSSFPLSVSLTMRHNEGGFDRGDTYWFALVHHDITAALSFTRSTVQLSPCVLFVLCMSFQTAWPTAWALIISSTQ